MSRNAKLRNYVGFFCLLLSSETVFWAMTLSEVLNIIGLGCIW
jgi:hypothetical protein